MVFGSVAALLAAGRSADVPKGAWAGGEPLPYVQVGALALWFVAQLAIVIAGRWARRGTQLEDACREVAAFVDEQCDALPLRYVGVRIWIVAGAPWAKHLRMGARFLLVGERPQTGIRWVKGKGVVGSAWEQRLNVSQDLAVTRGNASTQEEFERLPESERRGLSWGEFQKTPNFQAVLAFPLYSRTQHSGDPEVLGVMAIDVLATGYFDQLKAATNSPEFEGVIGTCEYAINA